MSITKTVNKAFHIITDWLLILMGGALVFISYRAIDVPIVKYTIMVIGTAMAIIGIWSRLKSMRKSN